MAATIAYEVTCDCPGCPDCHDAGTGAKVCIAALIDYGTATRVRSIARTQGWRTGLRGGKDSCPACAKNPASFT